MRKVWTSAGVIAAGVACAISLSTSGLLLTLGALCGAALIAAGLARPRILVLIALFAIYTNLPVIAVKYHGAPTTLALVPVLLVGIPLTYHLLVRRERLIIDVVLRLMLVFLGVLLLASAFAEEWSIALTWITVFLSEGLLIYLLFLNVIRDRSMLRGAIWALLVAGAFMGATSVYGELTRSYHSDLGGFVQRKTAADERAGPDTVTRDRLEGTFSTSRRSSGPVGEVNRFAQILLVLLPLAYFRFRGEQRLVLRLAALLVGGAILAGFLLTYSRSAFLVLVGIVGLLTLLRHLRPAHFFGLGLLLLLLVLAVPGYRSRVASIADVRGLGSHSRGVEADGATRGRLTEMLAAFRTFVDHPLLGVGPGQYEPFYSMEYQVNSPDALRYIPQPRRAHSLYLELAAETGVIGVFSFLAIPFVLLMRLRRISASSAEGDPELANLATACWFAVVSYLGMAVFLHLAYQRYFWLLIALAGAAVQLARAPRARPVDTEHTELGPGMSPLQTQG